MAIVVVEKAELEKLAGRKLSKEDIEEKIPMMGTPLERSEEGKLAYEIFPNRPDMLSVEGFARATRSFLGIKPGFAEYAARKSSISLVSDSSVKARPHIACGVARNVKITDEVLASLMQLQEKLHDTIGRKRKKAAIGLYDLDKTRPPFKYTALSPDKITFAPLDSERKMSAKEILNSHQKGIVYRSALEGHEKYPVILDRNNNTLALIPIINSEDTKVTKATRNILMDVTGTDAGAVGQCLNIICTALAERGCIIESVSINGKDTPNLSPRKMKVSLVYINKLLGLSLSVKEFTSLLNKMGLGYSDTVIIPPYRTDIMHEMDIAEEIAIAYGYQNFKPAIPNLNTTAIRSSKAEFLSYAKSLVAGLGFQEIITMILTNERDEFSRMCLPEEKSCKTTHPVSQECTICRKSLLPSALKTLSRNKHRSYPQRIFEAGDVVHIDETAETGAADRKMLAAVISDSSVGYESLSTLLDAFLTNLGLDYSLKKSSHQSFIEGRTAHVISGRERIGIIGEIHPQVLSNWNLDYPVVAFELDMDKIYSIRQNIHKQ